MLTASAIKAKTEANRSGRIGASSLTDRDLDFIGYSPREMRSLGSSDARNGDPAQYPKSRIYMEGYRYRQMQMQRDHQGPHCVLPMCEGTYFAWSA